MKTTPWLLPAIFSMILWGVWGLFQKLATNHMPPRNVYFFATTNLEIPMKKTILGTILAIICLAHLPALAAELPSSNEAAVKAALSSWKPTVADFGARSCIPCKKMAPILEELNRELSR